MTQFKALIFDLDGTLIHSAPDIHASANAGLQQMGRETLDLPTIISFIGEGIGVLTERCLNATGGCDPETHAQTLSHILAAYEANMASLTKPYEGVITALDGFKARSVPMGICTNKPHQPAQDICAAMDLAAYFGVISGAQDGAPRKPDAAPLLACIEEMGVAAEDTLYVGDSKIDHDTAANAGVAFRLFGGGYLNHPLPDLSPTDRFESWITHGITTV